MELCKLPFVVFYKREREEEEEEANFVSILTGPNGF
jgi:hypothetical protein